MLKSSRSNIPSFDGRPISTIFIDESGSKHSRGGFFVLGFVKSRDTAQLSRSIRQIRQKHKFFNEIKFASITRDSQPFYMDLITMLATSNIRIGASVYNAKTAFSQRMQTWEAQAEMSARLIVGNLNKGEVMNVFLDLVETPQGKSIAQEVRDRAMRRQPKGGIIGVYGLDSRSTDMLQIADIIAGSIRYERVYGKLKGLETTPKAYVALFLQNSFSLDSFDDLQQDKINILTMANPITY